MLYRKNKMNSRFWRMTALLLSMIMMLSMCACGSGVGQEAAPAPAESAAAPESSDAQQAEAAASGETIEVTVWLLSWWENEVDRIQKEFAEENPGYTCKIELVPINNYVENAATSIMGGNSPDVLALDGLMIPTLVSQNMLMPLDDMMSRYGLTPDLYSEVAYNAALTDGVPYAIPYRICSSGLWYNKTMFDEAGLDYPDADMDFDEFLEVCKALTIPGQQYGYGIAASKSDPSNVMTSFAPVLWGFGGDFLNEDLTECVLNTPESIAGIEYWVNLYTKEKVVPEGCINYAITKDLFPLAMNQQIAMIPMADGPLVGVDAYAEEGNFEWGMTLLPGYARAAGWYLTIPVSAKNVEGAEIFMDWFTKPEVLAKQNAVLPAVLEAQKMGNWADPFWDIFWEVDTRTKSCPNTPQWTQIQTIVTEQLQKALLEEITPEEAAQNMYDQINDLL